VKHTLWTLLIVLLLSACSKEEPAPVAKVDDDHLLTDHAWKSSRVEIIGDENLTNDEKELLRQKYTYETLLFKTDGKFIIENNYGYSVKYGRWHINDDYKSMWLDIGYRWMILELSENALTVDFAGFSIEEPSPEEKVSSITLYFEVKK
jgi:hypothetical protein